MNCIDKKMRVAALGIEKVDNRIWFSAVEKNGIYVVEDDYSNVEFVKYFEEESISQDVLYACVKEWNGKLLFSPNRASKIAVYDIASGEMQYIDIPETETEKLNEKYNPEVKFNRIIVEEGAAYILGYSFPGIIKIKDGTIKILDDWVREINDKIPAGDQRGYTTEGYVRKDREIYIPSGCCNYVIVVNLDSDETTIREIPCCFEGIGGISYLPDGRAAIVGRGKGSNYIIFWNIEENTCSECLISNEIIKAEFPFYSPVVYKEDLFLFPLLDCNSVYKISIKDLSIEKISLNLEIKPGESPRYPWITMGIFEEKGIVRFITGKDLMWHLFDLDTYELFDYEIKHEISGERYYQSILDRIKENNEIVNEAEVPLNMFLKLGV